jgi:hypothetical protein
LEALEEDDEDDDAITLAVRRDLTAICSGDIDEAARKTQRLQDQEVSYPGG